MKISLLHEEDVRQAAQRVVTLSREQLGRIVGLRDDGAKDHAGNPYVRVFVELFRYAKGTSTDDHQAVTCLEVAGSVLGNPLYAGAEGETESPLLKFVLLAADARRKQRAGGALSSEETSILE